jgi:hypothetical protein
MQHVLRGEMLLHCRKDVEGAGREYETALALSPHLRAAVEGMRMVRAAGARGGPLR